MLDTFAGYEIMKKSNLTKKYYISVYKHGRKRP